MIKNLFGGLQMEKGVGVIDNIEAGKRVKKLRKSHGLTQEKLAEILMVTTTAVRGYESGEYGMPKDVLLRMKEHFNISLDYLLFGDDTNKNDILALLESISDENKMEVLLYLLAYFVVVKKEGSMYEVDRKEIIENLKNIFGDKKNR